MFSRSRPETAFVSIIDQSFFPFVRWSFTASCPRKKKQNNHREDARKNTFTFYLLRPFSVLSVAIHSLRVEHEKNKLFHLDSLLRVRMAQKEWASWRASYVFFLLVFGEQWLKVSMAHMKESPTP